jgi:hypothetical protein
MRRRLLLMSSIVLLASGIAAPFPAQARVPRGFVGMAIGGPFFYPDMNENAMMAQIVASGAQSVRTLFDWAGIQPYPNFSAVPPSLRGEFQDVGGVPTNFSPTDQIVALAASHRATILPVLEYAPRWDVQDPGNGDSNGQSPPKSTGPFARFAAALVSRYGPNGSFWAQHPGIPRVPIRMWQIWNEPNFITYWSTQPFERSYVNLLRAAHNAIKAADQGAKVVLAGLTNFSWDYLRRIYKIRGARRLFDVVAAHPYTANPSGVVTILEKVRAVMDRFGDRRKPIIASEISWPSAKGQAQTLFENATTESGQAGKTARAVRLLARDRRKLGLQAFYYYTWITNETQPGARVDPFNFAGLFRFIDNRGTFVKPAYAAWVRAVRAIER